MKRSWFGFGLLLVLLGTSLLVSWGMARIHREIPPALNQAAELALEERWPEAEHYAAVAAETWEKWANVRRCFADHTPVEAVDSGFAQLMAYGKSREGGEFAASCAALAKEVAAMTQAHTLSWWNVF